MKKMRIFPSLDICKNIFMPFFIKLKINLLSKYLKIEWPNQEANYAG